MKTIYTLIVIAFFSAFAKAQETPSPSVQSPTIGIKLALGKSIQLDDVTITFEKVLEDSRCPKDVQCVWAGQIKVQLKIEEKNRTSTQKNIIFSPTSKDDKIVYSSDVKSINALEVMPYPQTNNTVAEREYILLLQEVKQD